jgi:hypothetical protein
VQPKSAIALVRVVLQACEGVHLLIGFALGLEYLESPPPKGFDRCVAVALERVLDVPEPREFDRPRLREPLREPADGTRATRARRVLSTPAAASCRGPPHDRSSLPTSSTNSAPAVDSSDSPAVHQAQAAVDAHRRVELRQADAREVSLDERCLIEFDRYEGRADEQRSVQARVRCVNSGRRRPQAVGAQLLRNKSALTTFETC